MTAKRDGSIDAKRMHEGNMGNLGEAVCETGKGSSCSEIVMSA